MFSMASRICIPGNSQRPSRGRDPRAPFRGRSATRLPSVASSCSEPVNDGVPSSRSSLSLLTFAASSPSRSSLTASPGSSSSLGDDSSTDSSRPPATPSLPASASSDASDPVVVEEASPLSDEAPSDEPLPSVEKGGPAEEDSEPILARKRLRRHVSVCSVSQARRFSNKNCSFVRCASKEMKRLSVRTVATLRTWENGPTPRGAASVPCSQGTPENTARCHRQSIACTCSDDGTERVASSWRRQSRGGTRPLPASPPHKTHGDAITACVPR